MRYIYILFTLFFTSCSSQRQGIVFYLPKMKVLEQQSISDVGKNLSIGFSQYEGFYLRYTDSLFKKIFLITHEQDIIESKEISKREQEELMKLKVESLLIKYTFKDSSSMEEVEIIVQRYFGQYKVIKNSSNFKIIDSCNNLIAEIVYKDFALPNILIQIYPTKESCLMRNPK